MINPQIAEYITTQLSQNKSIEDIYKDLLYQNVTVAEIQQGFSAIETSAGQDDTQKKTIHSIVTVAAILVGAGIFSFIASNWQSMAQMTKVMIILASMIGIYSLGWYLKEKHQLIKTGEALILLGVILYGAGIFLVAQMFNIRANWPDGFIVWMVGTIVMAFAIDSYVLFYTAIPLAIIALGAHPFVIINSFGTSPFLLTSSFLLLLTTILIFATGIVIRNRMPKSGSAE